MTHLFAYGTLMCEDIMREVAGCRLPNVRGKLRGYSRRIVKGELYPALVQDEAGQVSGLVFRDVPPAAWERLDRFEGEMYRRQSVQVELADSKLLQAAAYVVRPEFLGHLDLSDWDFDRFLRSGKKRFLQEYRKDLST
jgi:gamma-glutamylcyclotransferase (GGCT)/AIG2-like uncharacterized protein YtfP